MSRSRGDRCSRHRARKCHETASTRSRQRCAGSTDTDNPTCSTRGPDPLLDLTVPMPDNVHSTRRSGTLASVRGSEILGRVAGAIRLIGEHHSGSADREIARRDISTVPELVVRQEGHRWLPESQSQLTALRTCPASSGPTLVTAHFWSRRRVRATNCWSSPAPRRLRSQAAWINQFVDRRAGFPGCARCTPTRLGVPRGTPVGSRPCRRATIRTRPRGPQ